MRHGSPLRIFGVGVAIATVFVVVISLLVWLARGMVVMPVSFGGTATGILGLVISPICYAAVGGVLVARLPTNPIGWFFLAIGVAIGVMLPVNLLVAAAHEALRPAGAPVIWLAWARTVFGTPVVLTAAVVAVQLFPDGRALAGRWRFGPWLAVVAGGLLLAITALDPVGLVTYPSIPNPTGLPYATRGIVALVRLAAVLLLLSSAALAVASLWRRYRAGDPVLRAQLRWIVAAVIVTVVLAVPFVLARYVLRVTDATGEVLAATAQIGACAFPLAAALAIARYRLYSIDVMIGRTLVYLPLMAVLGGLYSAGIALFQRLFVALTGSESEIAILMTILVVASAFTPMRRALESVVDRRFAHDTKAGGEAADASSGPDDATAHTMPVHGTVRPVAADGTVACPLRRRCTLRDCVRCPRLIAVVDRPDVAVVCGPEP